MHCLKQQVFCNNVSPITNTLKISPFEHWQVLHGNMVKSTSKKATRFALEKPAH